MTTRGDHQTVTGTLLYGRTSDVGAPGAVLTHSQRGPSPGSAGGARLEQVIHVFVVDLVKRHPDAVQAFISRDIGTVHWETRERLNTLTHTFSRRNRLYLYGHMKHWRTTNC